MQKDPLCLNADTFSLSQCRQTVSVLMQSDTIGLNSERHSVLMQTDPLCLNTDRQFLP